MILKIPCEIKNEVTTLLIRRDAINVVQSLEDGAYSLIYVNNIAQPLKAKVRFQLLASFLGRAHGEGSMKVPEDKGEKTEMPQIGQREPNA